MALKGLVKVSSVNNLSDARYVAGMGVEFMGFDLDPQSGSRISAETFAAITGWVSGVKLVGEFSTVDSTLPLILDKYPIDMIQISNPGQSPLESLSLPIIIKIDRPEETYITQLLAKYEKRASYFLLEFEREVDHYGLTAQLEDWSGNYPLILGSPLTPDQALNWLDRGIKGIALKGGDEIKPGYKDFDELAHVLEALEIDDL